MDQYRTRQKEKRRKMAEPSFDQLADKAEADLVSQFLDPNEIQPPYSSSCPPSPMSEASDNEKEDNDDDEAANDGQIHKKEFCDQLKTQVNQSTPYQAEIPIASVDEIVTRCVSQLADTIQALVVPERLEREIQMADDWRNLCRAICNNARLINSKLSFTRREDITNNLEGLKPDFLQPHLLTWQAFLQHPLSATCWRLMQKHNLCHDDNAWQKWWKRVQTKSKKQPWTKLATYNQALQYYESSSNTFWSQWSYNPTMLSVEDITASLTTQADWLRAAGINNENGFKIVEKFYQAAKKIAESNTKVSTINEILKPLWPSGFVPQNLHYKNSPFDSMRLELFIDRSKALVTWPLENYRFDPEQVWATPDNDGPTIIEPAPTKYKPSEMAQEFVAKMKNYTHVDESQRREFMNFLKTNEQN